MREKKYLKDRVFTQTGKAASAFTLKCWFKDGNEFTYRGDSVLKEVKNKNLPLETQLEALNYKFRRLKNSIEVAILYDNTKPKEPVPEKNYTQDVVMQYELGVFVHDFRPKLNNRSNFHSK